ncbi:hypothetical protein HYH02_000260 [Chlamydomonas schloesseri]|uniref:Uncharacterized protein n=1 Tax=Chlamydomonas schloesseri TaxID=2026947 RepID=A0A836B7Z8_9CHLO|nr:hypothetical protein HYH02_000260 [Chlamydomonas schloesseri]|eukprot:KAG2450158.1 hypothetical protein HYH02_000260 [Chlamydomonas schloesseri]
MCSAGTLLAGLCVLLLLPQANLASVPKTSTNEDGTSVAKEGSTSVPTQNTNGLGRRRLAQTSNTTSNSTTSRYAQSSCLCNKFAQAGNLTADYNYLCFSADACGGPQYTIPTSYLQSTDCNSTNTTGCEVLPTQYDSCRGWISATSNTSVPCPTYACCQTVQQPANVTYCASLGQYCFNVGPSPDGSTYDRFCTTSPQQTSGREYGRRFAGARSTAGASSR